MSGTFDVSDNIIFQRNLLEPYQYISGKELMLILITLRFWLVLQDVGPWLESEEEDKS